MLLLEDPVRPTGGLGVHVRHLAGQLCRHVELTVVGIDVLAEEGGCFLVDADGRERAVDPPAWTSALGSWRLLRVLNRNDLTLSGSAGSGYHDLVILDQFLFSVLERLGRERFDLIHIHDSPLWRVGRSLAALWQSRLVMTCHLSCGAVHPYTPGGHWAYMVQTELSAFSKADAVITVSEAYRRTMADVMLLDEDGINVVPNGVDADFLATVPPSDKLREQYLQGRERLAVFVGRMVPTKGVSLLLEAARQLQDWAFVLIADMAPTVEQVIPLVGEVISAELELDNLTWLRDCTQAKKWRLMRSADGGVMPSRHEPVGIVALEWMGLRVPLIVTQVGGLADFCGEHNSTPIEPTADALVAALRSHERDEGRLARGLQTAREHSWGRAAASTLRIYEEVADG